MDTYLDVGTVVESLAGHDKGRRYLILGFTGADFILISDGKYHKIENPKLKRIKHIKPLSKDKYLLEEIEKKSITDNKIINVIKNFQGDV